MTTTFAEVVEGVRATIAALHPRPRRRPHRRRRRHLLPRRRLRAARASARSRATTRCARPTPGGRRGGPSATSSSTRSSPTGTTTRPPPISDVVLIVQGDAGWAIQFVARYHDVLHHDDGTWRFHRRTVGVTAMQPDMSWVGVLEHHAGRTPDKPIAVLRRRRRHLPGDGRSGPPRWPPASHARGVGAGDVVGLLSYNSIEFLTTIFAANHLGAIAMPINWRLAAEEVRVHPRPLAGAGARVRRRARRARRRRDEPARPRPRPGLRHRPSTVDGWERFADLGAGAARRRPRARRAATTSTGSCTRRARPGGRRA